MEAFSVFDTNTEGHFNARQLNDVAQMLKCNFSKDDIQEMIAVADLNGDGFIDYEEFVRIMLTQE